MITGPPTPHNYMSSAGGPGQGYPAPHQFDTTGQVAPPGMKPRVTATLWEDEGSLCFQVEAKGVCVARREGQSFPVDRKLIPGGLTGATANLPRQTTT
jgi:protein SOK2